MIENGNQLELSKDWVKLFEGSLGQFDKDVSNGLRLKAKRESFRSKVNTLQQEVITYETLKLIDDTKPS